MDGCGNAVLRVGELMHIILLYTIIFEYICCELFQHVFGIQFLSK